MIAKKEIKVHDGNDWFWKKNYITLKNEWRFIDGDELMKCDDCGHKSKEWAEHDDLTELVGLEKEEHFQVRCPKCKSWYYWEV